MFKLTYADPDLGKKLQALDKHYPPEVCNELRFYLQTLRKDGQLSRTDFYDVNTHRISGSTLYLFYRPNIIRDQNRFTSKEVLIIDVQVKPADVFKQRFTVLDDWDDSDVLPVLAQYDKPQKLISAIDLISKGIHDSYDLGYALGHRGKHKSYIKRHGQYAKQALEQLKLISRERKGRKFLVSLSNTGESIAKAPNAELKFSLLVRAMVNYRPVWTVIEAVTNMEGSLSDVQVLNEELIKTLVVPEELRDSDTSHRRSQTLKNWIKWISKREGIPIRIHNEGLQLPIPMIFAGNKNDSSITDL